MRKIFILIACVRSQVECSAFRELGANAVLSANDKNFRPFDVE